jgi:hypothetical protein
LWPWVAGYHMNASGLLELIQDEHGLLGGHTGDRPRPTSELRAMVLTIWLD